MRKKPENPISLKFVIFVLAFFLVFVLYISSPNDMKKLNKSKTFEEMLEYTNKNTSANNQSDIDKQKGNKVQRTEEFPGESQIKNSGKETVKQKSQQLSYNELLDNMIEYPIKDRKAVLNAVNKLLIYKGYPANTIQVLSSDIDQSRSKTQGSYMAASFEFKTGNFNISENVLYNMNSKVLTAIIVHEIDHFDKLAKVCKYLGINKFKELFQENNISDLNIAFWTKASQYANPNDINPDYYTDALKRFLTQNKLELLSSYSDFYRISENMRNPLEISAYEASDYVFNYYKIPITDGPMKQLTQKFNDVDWAIYNAISNDPLLKDERIAMFDYFFLNAIISRYPVYQKQFQDCINNKNGDLTEFWLAFENDAKSFYQKGQMDNATFNKMINLLGETKEEVKKGITAEKAAEALKYKINTLAANLVYPNALDNLKIFSLNYLNYIKQKNINAPEQELRCILTLICIENELYTNNSKDISLYYIKIPEDLTKLYNIKNKRQKFLFIYNNQFFKNKLNTAENEQSLLKELLNQSRLNIKIKN